MQHPCTLTVFQNQSKSLKISNATNYICLQLKSIWILAPKKRMWFLTRKFKLKIFHHIFKHCVLPSFFSSKTQFLNEINFWSCTWVHLIICPGPLDWYSTWRRYENGLWHGPWQPHRGHRVRLNSATFSPNLREIVQNIVWHWWHRQRVFYDPIC